MALVVKSWYRQRWFRRTHPLGTTNVGTKAFANASYRVREILRTINEYIEMNKYVNIWGQRTSGIWKSISNVIYDYKQLWWSGSTGEWETSSHISTSSEGNPSLRFITVCKATSSWDGLDQLDNSWKQQLDKGHQRGSVHQNNWWICGGATAMPL